MEQFIQLNHKILRGLTVGVWSMVFDPYTLQKLVQVYGTLHTACAVAEWSRLTPFGHSVTAPAILMPSLPSSSRFSSFRILIAAYISFRSPPIDLAMLFPEDGPFKATWLTIASLSSEFRSRPLRTLL